MIFSEFNSRYLLTCLTANIFKWHVNFLPKEKLPSNWSKERSLKLKRNTHGISCIRWLKIHANDASCQNKSVFARHGLTLSSAVMGPMVALLLLVDVVEYQRSLFCKIYLMIQEWENVDEGGNAGLQREYDHSLGVRTKEGRIQSWGKTFYFFCISFFYPTGKLILFCRRKASKQQSEFSVYKL